MSRAFDLTPLALTVGSLPLSLTPSRRCPNQKSCFCAILTLCVCVDVDTLTPLGRQVNAGGNAPYSPRWGFQRKAANTPALLEPMRPSVSASANCELLGSATDAKKSPRRPCMHALQWTAACIRVGLSNEQDPHTPRRLLHCQLGPVVSFGMTDGTIRSDAIRHGFGYEQ